MGRATSKMVQCAESYGTLGGITPRRAESRRRFNLQAVAPKVAAMMMLGFAAVVGVAVLSSHVGTRAELAEEQLHARGFSVADAILKADGVHDKKSAIPSSIAALAAQAAQEKETGQLSATVELPQIPKKIAAMAAEAKHEILIEQKVDKKKAAKKAAMTAAKAAASKASSSRRRRLRKRPRGRRNRQPRPTSKKCRLRRRWRR